MKIAVLQFFSWPERRVDLAAVYARALERIEIMDRTGYDAVWLAEHHFSSFSVCPSVHMMGALAAARTTRLRIGTGVSLGAVLSPAAPRRGGGAARRPLRRAGQLGRRARLRPGRVREFRGAAARKAPRAFARRSRSCCAPGPRTGSAFAGTHFHFDDVEVLPKPLQQPHPPVWMAATSEAALEWAAGRGFSILMDPHASHRDIGHKRRFYAERLTAAGFSMAGRDLPVARLVALGDTGAKAAEVARRGAQWIVDSYFGAAHRPVGIADPNTPGTDPVQRYLDEVILHGTPDAVLDQILRLREEIGLDYLLCAPLSHADFHAC